MNIKYDPTVRIGRDDFYLISEPTVMRSAAGWYVGRQALTYSLESRDDEDGIPMPYDRLTGYFDTEEDAKRALLVCTEEFDGEPIEDNPPFAMIKELWINQNPEGERPWERS